MPKRIVPQFRICETCPAPECNLSESDVEQFVEEFEIYVALLASGFRRRDQFEWGGIYLNGLLGDTPRKTSEGMALDLNANVRDLQHFIGQSPWQKAPVLVIHQRLIAETLGEVDGVMLIDESGVVKQGQHSVGVAPNTVGRWARWPTRKWAFIWGTSAAWGTAWSTARCSCRMHGSKKRTPNAERRAAFQEKCPSKQSPKLG